MNNLNIEGLEPYRGTTWSALYGENRHMGLT